MSDDQQVDPSDASLPVVGEDLAPTPEQIVEGRIGNGSWERISPQIASRLQAERAEMKREIKRSRREAYEDGMKDALRQVSSLQQGILDIGVELLKRLELGETLTRKELDTLKLAQSSAKEVADRAVGKPKTTAEVKNETSILHLLMGKVEHGD